MIVARLTNPSGVTSVDASPPGISLESMIIHDGPSCTKVRRVRSVDGPRMDTHNLVQTLRSSETCRASTDDQDIEVASIILSTMNSVIRGNGDLHFLARHDDKRIRRGRLSDCNGKDERTTDVEVRAQVVKMNCLRKENFRHASSTQIIIIINAKWQLGWSKQFSPTRTTNPLIR